MNDEYTDIQIHIHQLDTDTGTYAVEAALDDGSFFADGELFLDQQAYLLRNSTPNPMAGSCSPPCLPGPSGAPTIRSAGGSGGGGYLRTNFRPVFSRNRQLIGGDGFITDRQPARAVTAWRNGAFGARTP